MATTASPNRPRARSRVPESAPARGGETDGNDHQYDLLTAALLGVVLGAGATLLLRRGPSGRSPIVAGAVGVARGARQVGRLTSRRRKSLLERVPVREVQSQVRDYVGRAREAIDDAVDAEVRNLRKAIRRQRKRVGL